MGTQRSLMAFTLGVGLTLTLLATMSLSSEMAQAASKDWFVTVSGTGTACSQTSPCPLATAVAGASDGDTIYLAGGTYTGTSTEVIAVTGNVTILGGWDGASSGAVVRDPGAYPTILDGQNSRRVVYITGTVSPRLEGLTFTRGNAAGLGGRPIPSLG